MVKSSENLAQYAGFKNNKKNGDLVSESKASFTSGCPVLPGDISENGAWWGGGGVKSL